VLFFYNLEIAARNAGNSGHIGRLDQNWGPWRSLWKIFALQFGLGLASAGRFLFGASLN